MPLVVYPARGYSLFDALGGFGRWLWRYRSELAPVYWTVVTVLAGAWLHHTHPRSWPVPLAVAGLTVGALFGLLGLRRQRLSHRAILTAGPAGAGGVSGAGGGALGTRGAARTARAARVAWFARVGRWMRVVRFRLGVWLLARIPVLQRRGVRVWVAAVVATTGGWLSAATAVGTAGPAQSDGTPSGALRTVAWLAMLVLGVPWWWSHDRRRLVRVRRVMDYFPDTAYWAGLGGARMTSAVLDRWGWTARLRLRRGHHAQHALNAAPALESALGARVGSVRIEPVPSDASQVTLRVIETDPHALPIPWPDPTMQTMQMGAQVAQDGAQGLSPGLAQGLSQGSLQGRSVADPVTLGVWEDGGPVRVSLLRKHVLIGGTTGAGKSGLLNVILADLVRCADVVLWGVDLKEGMELAPWRTCLQHLAVSRPDAVALLRAAVTELERRAETLAARGLREWTPSRSAPALVIVVDEYAELPAAARKWADSIARRGRAVAVTLLVATQRPTQKAMGSGTAIRSQMDVRICFRVRERGDVDLILGQGMHKNGWDTTGFDAPGKFLLSAPEHHTPRRARAYLITDEQIQYTATDAAANRPPGTHPDPGDSRGSGGSGGTGDGGTTSGTTSGGRDRSGGQEGGNDPGHNPGNGAGLLDPLSPTIGRDLIKGDPAERTEGNGGRADGDGGSEGPVSGPDVVLWVALRQAGSAGVTVAELVAVSGLSRRSVYRRLQTYARTGQVTRLGNGRWTATPPPADAPGDPSDEPKPPGHRDQAGNPRVGYH